MRWCLALACLAAACAARAEPPAPTAADGIMIDSIDKSVEPCEDFYHFVCNGWLKASPIPADQSSWDVGAPLVERNNEILKGILDEAAARPTPETQRIGDFWSACMDEDAIAAKGVAALRPERDAIDAMVEKRDLAPVLAHLQRIGVPVLFDFGSDQDARDATQMIAEADQGGLGLPDRSYYLKTDRRSGETRAAYADHLARMAVLAGAPEAQAKADAQTVLRLETALAQASLSDEARIDPHGTYHKLARAALDRLVPGFAWDDYLTRVGAPPVDSLNVAVPSFFKALGTLLAATPLDDMKAYLRAHLIEADADLLPAPFAEESFHFYGETLRGAKALKPRWKRCVALTDQDLGEDLGRLYVAKVFPPESKAAIKTLVDRIKAAFAEDLKTVPWMGEETRAKAEDKLAAMAEKIGYPDKWRDYSALEIRRDDALGNHYRAAAFELDRELGLIGKPVDKGEWGMTPPTVNAYYDDSKNDINFPAGTLQPPYYDVHWDDAVDYGSIGSTIGHEMTHGFDNSGRMFDAHGNLKDWWTRKDAKSFTSRAQCLVKEYDGFQVAAGLHLNGALTLTENTADNGGTHLAFLALEAALAGKTQPMVDGYTPEQRFFIAYGQSFCENQTEAGARLQALTDPHSTSEFRVNGVVRNMPAFREAFSCKEGAPMAPANPCKVW